MEAASSSWVTSEIKQGETHDTCVYIESKSFSTIICACQPLINNKFMKGAVASLNNMVVDLPNCLKAPLGQNTHVTAGSLSSDRLWPNSKEGLLLSETDVML